MGAQGAFQDLACLEGKEDGRVWASAPHSICLLHRNWLLLCGRRWKDAKAFSLNFQALASQGCLARNLAATIAATHVCLIVSHAFLMSILRIHNRKPQPRAIFVIRRIVASSSLACFPDLVYWWLGGLACMTRWHLCSKSCAIARSMALLLRAIGRVSFQLVGRGCLGSRTVMSGRPFVQGVV